MHISERVIDQRSFPALPRPEQKTGFMRKQRRKIKFSGYILISHGEAYFITIDRQMSTVFADYSGIFRPNPPTFAAHLLVARYLLLVVDIISNSRSPPDMSCHAHPSGERSAPPHSRGWSSCANADHRIKSFISPVIRFRLRRARRCCRRKGAGRRANPFRHPTSSPPLLRNRGRDRSP